MDAASNVVKFKKRETPKVPKPPRHSDRNFFLGLLLIIWIGVLAGFGGDIAHHYAKSGLDYPVIVHVHAALYVGWLVLLTTQIGLIRAGNTALHKKLGILGACLAVVMVIVGPATEIVTDGLKYGKPGADPAFQSIAFAGVLLFGLMSGAALLWRKYAAAHKRLMLLGTLAISNAGFARWLFDPLFALAGQVTGPVQGPAVAGFWAGMYFIPTVLVLSIGVYDLITRRGLVMAWVWGALLCVIVQLASVGLYFQPWWLEVTKRLLGH